MFNLFKTFLSVELRQTQVSRSKVDIERFIFSSQSMQHTDTTNNGISVLCPVSFTFSIVLFYICILFVDFCMLADQ